MVTPDVSHETMLYPWHDSSYNKGLPSETHVGSSSVFSTVEMAPAELGLQFKVNLEKTFHSPRLSALQVGACAGTRKPNEQLEWSEARSHGIRLGYNFYQSTPPPHGAEEEAPRVKWHVDPSTLGTVSLGHALLTPAAREKCARIERAMLRYDADTLLATESGVLATALAQLEKHDARLVRAFTALQSVGGLSDNERHALQSALQSVHTSHRHVGPTRMSVQSTHAINVSHVGSTPPSLSHDESSQTGPTGKQTKAHLPIVGALNTAPKSRQSVLDTARALLKEHAAVHQATMMLVDRWDVAWCVRTQEGVADIPPSLHADRPPSLHAHRPPSLTGLPRCMLTGLPRCMLTGLPRCMLTGLPRCMQACDHGRGRGCAKGRAPPDDGSRHHGARRDGRGEPRLVCV